MTIEEKKKQIVSMYLGDFGIHGVGIGGEETINVYYSEAQLPSEKVDQNVALLDIDILAKPFNVKRTECPMAVAL